MKVLQATDASEMIIVNVMALDNAANLVGAPEMLARSRPAPGLKKMLTWSVREMSANLRT